MTIARKELMHVRRDPRLIASIFLIPLIQLLLFSYALSFDIKNIPTIVYDNDNSQLSKKLVSTYQNSTFFNVVEYADNPKEIDEAIDHNVAKVSINIPPGFSKKIARGEKVAVQVLVDGSEPNASLVASGYISAITQQFSSRIVIDTLNRFGLSQKSASLIEIRSRLWYNPNRKSVNFMIPGIIVLIMTNITITQTALALVREKDHGTIEQLIVSPLKTGELMIGKVLPFIFIVTLDVFIISVVGIFGFGVPFRGSILLMALSSGLFVLSGLGLGLLISAVSNSMETANQLGFFVALLPAFMLSGFMWPLENIPVVLQYFSRVFPPRYFVSILRGIFLKGSGLDILWPNILALFVISFISISLATLIFKLKERG
jgi:ABC-2 type transport system permease protein